MSGASRYLSSYRLAGLLAAAALAAAVTPAAAGCCACASSCGTYGQVQEVQVWGPSYQYYMVSQGPDYSGNYLTNLPTIEGVAPVDYPYVGFYRRHIGPYHRRTR